MMVRISLLALLLMTSSCASARLASQKSYATDRWSVVLDPKTNQYVVIAKGNVDLKEALDTMGCSKQACSVGRVADIYAVTRLASEKKKGAKPTDN